MTAPDIPLYERPAFRRAAGSAWRPGGPALTRRALELGERLCGLPSGGRVLDAGCGTGATLELCASLGYVALGADLRPHLAGNAAAVPVLRADIRRLPLAHACCDAVLCECVLSLLDDPETALAEVRRVLRPGGALLLTDLYLRDRPTDGRCRAALNCALPAARSCADGAAPWPVLRDRLIRQGFTVRHMEDHSRALAELAARCIFQGQSLAELGLSCRGGDPRRYGYLLAAARAAHPLHASSLRPSVAV